MSITASSAYGRTLFKIDARAVVIDRFFDLAVARLLQSGRCADVVLARSFTGANDACRSKFGSRFAKLKKLGVVDGKVQGKDINGYDYKRWTLIDSGKAKAALELWHIRPMRPDAIGKLHTQKA